MRKLTNQADSRQADIEQITSLFRASTIPMWRALRAAVVERGVLPDRSCLAVSFEDNQDYEFGILVTQDRHVVQYGFRGSENQWRIVEWADITDRVENSPHREDIEIALDTIASVQMKPGEEGIPMWKHPVFLAVFVGSSFVFSALSFGFLRVLAELPIWLSIVIAFPTGVAVFLILLYLQIGSDGPAR